MQKSSGAQTCGSFYRSAFTELCKSHLFVCQICYKQSQRVQIQSLAECGHDYFCKSCLSIYFRIKLMTYQEIHCPLQNCSAILDTQSAFWSGLSEQLKNRYKKFKSSLEKQRDANFRSCPSGDCQGNIVFQGNAFKCTVCSQQFCLNCMNKVHTGNCDFEEAIYLQATLNLRRCPNCKFIIQKNSGCDYIKCICNFQLCFRCNAHYAPLHRCQKDALQRIVVKKPSFKTEKMIEANNESSNSFQYQQKQGSINEHFCSIAFMIVFIIPYLVGLSLVYMLRMALPTILLLLKLASFLIGIAVLGVAPFTIELVNQFNPQIRYTLLGLYPLTMIVGVCLSFKELLPHVINLILDNYIRVGKKLGKELFAN